VNLPPSDLNLTPLVFSTALPASAMAPRQNVPLEDIPSQIATKFDEAQSSVANHRKNCVNLYKLHVQASSIIQPAKKGKTAELIGEITFQDAFIDMVNRVLDIKKGGFADRIVKFVGSYVKFVNDKGASWAVLYIKAVSLNRVCCPSRRRKAHSECWPLRVCVNANSGR